MWKNVSVSAIPKVTPCLTVDQLRPISLTSVISKLQESYVVNWMNEYIEGKITEAQYGGWYTNGVKQWITRIKSLDHTIRIGSTPTFLYFDLYLYSAYAAH